MSRRGDAARARILTAARQLIEDQPYEQVSMGDIAAAAGLTRQAVYFHFESKSDLLTMLVEWVDEIEDIAAHFSKVAAATSGIDALLLGVEGVGAYEPRIHRLAMALATARRIDDAAAHAWEDRMSARRSAIRHAIEWIRRDGLLAPAWPVPAAVDLVWATTSPTTYDALVVDRGWSPRRWVAHTQRCLEDTLVRR